MVLVTGPNAPASARPRPASEYVAGPTAEAVRSGSAVLQRGQEGEGVRELQRLLNAAGANPPLAVDGRFGPLTEGALRQATGAATADRRALEGLEARRAANPGDGLGGGRPSHVPPAAPRYGAPPPAGTVRAGSLQPPDDDRRRAGQPPSTPATPPPLTPSTTPSGMKAGAPPGYHVIRGQVPPGVTTVAKSLLKHDYGTEIPFEVDGKRYLARLERHYHPPGYVGGPNGWHKGVTVYAAD